MKILPVGSVALALWAVLSVPGALSAPGQPQGEFKPFGSCPLDVKGVTDCLYATTSSGSISIGQTKVPLEKSLTLQGGFSGSGQEIKFHGATNGDTLARVPQPLPGGLVGVTAPTWWPNSLQAWFNKQIDKGVTDVTATLELAEPASSIELSTENLLNQEGTALGLPVKVKLENPILGSNCYVGSDAEPIQIDLTTGKSGSVSGSPGTVEFNKKYTLTSVTGGTLVNGTFQPVPARGCGGLLSFFMVPTVDSALGIPPAYNESTAILKGKYQVGAAASVRQSK